ncbi:E3 ubiquitin-protein ligase DZIP3-like, partial [Mercenaria mercenaria]|uniref:E3 ubiquitin-protein ligase DZIP3-like n=1 Tax=Mercenaria mercenaria TaxID=6596 RepID=UPI00234F5E15
MAAALPVSLTPTEEKADCFRLLSLIVDGGTLVLRYRFDQAIPPNDLQNTLNDANRRGKLNNLFKRKVLTQSQWDLLYPATGQPSSANFDVTLLTCLLRHICGLNEQSNAWSCIPPSFDVSIEADITRLRTFRNEVIKRLGQGIPNLHKDIQNLKDNSIDPEKERVYQEMMKEWEEMDKSLQIEIVDRLNQLQKQTVDNTKTIGYLEQKHQESTAYILAHETKISVVETKQIDLQEQIKKNTEQ